MDLNDRTLGRIMNRREVLAMIGATGASLLLAACGNGESDAETSTVTQNTTTQPTQSTSGNSSTAVASTEVTVASATTTTEADDATETSEATEPSDTSQVEGSPTTGDDATPAIVAAANAFLDTLTDTERGAVLFDWTDTEQKQRWSNFPEGLFERDGLMWGDMSEEAQNAWLGIMQAALSDEGYARVVAEWAADDVLAQEDGGGGPGGLLLGMQYYWIALIGQPSETDPWQWQWGGHHVTINATIVGENIALTPSFIGVQPATYTDSNGNTVRPLGDIADTAFELVTSLDETQQDMAVLGNSVIDLVLGPGQDNRTIEPEGLPALEMTEEQQVTLLTLIGYYTRLVNAEDAAGRVAEIEEGLAETYFAWYGPTDVVGAGYFRVTGPTVMIEFSPQSMGGDAANHIHGIYRDPTNDYGARYNA